MQMVSPRHSASLPGSNGRCGWWIQPDAVRSTPASDNGSPSGCSRPLSDIRHHHLDRHQSGFGQLLE
ncbi:hypothetical protein C7S13_8718 [Burkholderia cepacia]|nr:hypothetical protein [Burkholderia cepacia]